MSDRAFPEYLEISLWSLADPDSAFLTLRLTLSSGTITVRRPRVRDLEERFESRVLPLFAKRTQQVRPDSRAHGLAHFVSSTTFATFQRRRSS